MRWLLEIKDDVANSLRPLTVLVKVEHLYVYTENEDSENLQHQGI